jgi:hypothetical protein
VTPQGGGRLATNTGGGGSEKREGSGTLTCRHVNVLTGDVTPSGGPAWHQRLAADANVLYLLAGIRTQVAGALVAGAMGEGGGAVTIGRDKDLGGGGGEGRGEGVVICLWQAGQHTLLADALAAVLQASMGVLVICCM